MQRWFGFGNQIWRAIAPAPSAVGYQNPPFDADSLRPRPTHPNYFVSSIMSNFSDNRTSSLPRLIDLFICSLIVGAMLIVAYLKSIYPTWFPWLTMDSRNHLGAEYDCIAQAIRAGRGFSDPFHEPTGPTAWMPPVMPYLMAGIYWLNNDDRQSVIEWMVAMQGISSLLTAMIVANEARKLRQVLAGYVIIVLFYLANFNLLFQQAEWDVRTLAIAMHGHRRYLRSTVRIDSPLVQCWRAARTVQTNR